MKTHSFAVCSQWMHRTTWGPSSLSVSICGLYFYAGMQRKMQLCAGKVAFSWGWPNLGFIFVVFIVWRLQTGTQSTVGSLPEASCDVFRFLKGGSRFVVTTACLLEASKQSTTQCFHVLCYFHGDLWPEYKIWGPCRVINYYYYYYYY